MLYSRDKRIMLLILHGFVLVNEQKFISLHAKVRDNDEYWLSKLVTKNT